MVWLFKVWDEDAADEDRDVAEEVYDTAEQASKAQKNFLRRNPNILSYHPKSGLRYEIYQNELRNAARKYR